ncbi:hypothetical protein [Bacillus sp. FJAT-27245]|uniref:hypothetical protein n=1 Tax=Bacillus sp. FJAT-27245 TaxID=1684144 RepID=UPI0006A78812|nr:hypothetical protein [Bacillus sp. FJAT-27245]
MDSSAFFWSVIASFVAAVFLGATYKIVNKNKTKKEINQKGNNNTAFIDSSININKRDKE